MVPKILHNICKQIQSNLLVSIKINRRYVLSKLQENLNYNLPNQGVLENILINGLNAKEVEKFKKHIDYFLKKKIIRENGRDLADLKRYFIGQKPRGLFNQDNTPKKTIILFFVNFFKKMFKYLIIGSN